ncbi:unnamed protein product [Orchesella dallaii]|uniref:Helicase ATP-binding domain-containing protein n=1 Tax=Orchesella dallaii TaxID=48710 RepID=A0ABP1PWH6_9HEXA
MADDNRMGQGLGGDYENIVFLDGLHPEDDVQLFGEEDENIAPPDDEAQQQDANESDTDADEQKTRAESCIYNVLKTGRNLLLEHPVKTNRRLDNLSGAISYWDSAKCLEMEQPTKIYYATKRIDELDQVIALLNEMNLANNLLGGPLKVAVLKESNMHINEGETSRLHFRRDELPPRFPFGFQDVLLELAAANDVNTFLDTRRMYENAELIICPQQFIISPTLRQDYGIDLENAVLIFDEGYDMEKLCCNEASISLTSSELDQLVQQVVNMANSFLAQNRGAVETGRLLTFTFSLMTLSIWIKDHAASTPTRNEILEALEATHLEMEEIEYDNLDAVFKTALVICTNIPRIQQVILKLRKIVSVFRIFNGDNQNNYDLQLVNNNGNPTLKMICTNPATIFGTLASPTWSVVITSNCLAPISTFLYELGVNFHEVLQIEVHEAPNDRYVLAFCSAGIDEVRFTLNYQSRRDFAVQDSVGKSLLKISQAMPNGVVAIFHTSYLLEPLIERWGNQLENEGGEQEQQPSIMERLREVKNVFCESDDENQDPNELFEEYRVASRTERGALLFVLARGKLFDKIQTLRGDEVRAIVHVSVPYASWYTDDLVVAKRNRNTIYEATPEELRSNRNLAWYTKEAFRILNQAFGLCVQDQNDWGALIVLDSRVAGKQGQFDQLMPAWVRNEFHHQESFNGMINSLQNLVRRCGGNNNNQ